MTDQKEEKEHLFCPYCDGEIGGADLPFCQACQITLFFCPKCRQPVARDKKVCPYCGADILGEAKK